MVEAGFRYAPGERIDVPRDHWLWSVRMPVLQGAEGMGLMMERLHGFPSWRAFSADLERFRCMLPLGGKKQKGPGA